jgi:hypothetical protein
MINQLGEDGFFKYKNAIRTEALSMAIGVLELSADLEAAIDTLTKVRDSYALSSWPKDESTDHQL